MDEHEDGVFVAVDAQFDHVLEVAAGRAFVPQFPPAAAPEMRLAGGEGQFEDWRFM